MFIYILGMFSGGVNLFPISFLSSWSSSYLLLGYHSNICILVNWFIDLTALGFVLVISLSYYFSFQSLDCDIKNKNKTQAKPWSLSPRLRFFMRVAFKQHKGAVFIEFQVASFGEETFIKHLWFFFFFASI